MKKILSNCYIEYAACDKIVECIKNELANKKWKDFGWRNEILTKDDIVEISKILGINLKPVNKGFVPEITTMYALPFADTLVEIVAPYMTNGDIRIIDEQGMLVITYSYGRVYVKYKDNWRIKENVDASV